MKYIDAHCHFLSDDDMRDARAAGARGFIVNSTAVPDWARALEMAQQCCDVWPAIGIHPWHIGTAPAHWDAQMYDVLAANPKCMIGETGMDKYHPDIDAQEQIFARHMALAKEMARMAHVHCVGAWDRLMRVLATHSAPCIVMHSYSGHADMIPHLVRHNAYFSYSPALLNVSRRRMSDALVVTPLDRILVESDGPAYSPADIPLLVQHIAKLRNMDNNAMAEILFNNTQRILTHG